ncbi:hypothetical protein ABKV19_008372, partial [Rosa sericea]
FAGDDEEGSTNKRLAFCISRSCKKLLVVVVPLIYGTSSQCLCFQSCQKTLNIYTTRGCKEKSHTYSSSTSLC